MALLGASIAAAGANDEAVLLKLGGRYSRGHALRKTIADLLAIDICDPFPGRRDDSDDATPGAKQNNEAHKQIEWKHGSVKCFTALVHNT